MNKKIKSALISVFYKTGLEPIVKGLHQLGVTIYSTGGTQEFIEQQGVPVTPVESLTSYPAILGGRVKTLHPAIFGGILGRRELESDVREMEAYYIPPIDLVIVDLYPFEETLRSSNDERLIIEKIDIGGVSLIRAAAKNYKDVVIVASTAQYADLTQLVTGLHGESTITMRRSFAAAAFEVCARYDVAISHYFNDGGSGTQMGDTAGAGQQPSPQAAGAPAPSGQAHSLRYGENPHQKATFYGDLSRVFRQLHGKEISYNNLVDIDAALQLIAEFPATGFAIIKHTNVCGAALRLVLTQAWESALAGDPESAFGGVLVTNSPLDADTAKAIDGIFFEVLLAPTFEPAAMDILVRKKNRILLQYEPHHSAPTMFKSVLNGTLLQDTDKGNYQTWDGHGTREATDQEKEDLSFSNIICKHLKSNAIALVRQGQLVGKGCGQTSRIDALRQSIEKARHTGLDLQGAVLASDAFFPFDDSVRLAHEAGITAFIQPGGSIRDGDSIAYCKENGLAMVITGLRHFKH